MAKRNKKPGSLARLPSSSSASLPPDEQTTSTTDEPTAEPKLQLYSDTIQRQFEQYFSKVAHTRQEKYLFTEQMKSIWQLSPSECSHRGIQSIVNSLPSEKNLMVLWTNIDYELLEQNFVQMNALEQEESLQSAISLLRPLLTSTNVAIGMHRRVHRNMAALLAKLIRKPFLASFTRLPEENISLTLKYLASVLEQTGDVISDVHLYSEQICWAIIAAERLIGSLARTSQHQAAVENFKVLTKDSLKSYATLSFIPATEKKSGLQKFALDQLSLCALTLFTNIEMNEPNMYFNAKMTSDKLVVRVDSPEQPTTIRSAFAVTSGVHFYEVTVHQTGMYHFGWSTKEFCLDEVMLAFYGYSLKSAPPGEEASQPRFCQGDIVGCLLDMVQKKATFYLNGQSTEHNGKFVFHFDTNLFKQQTYQVLGLPPPPSMSKKDFSSQPYYPTATLFPHMQVAFNFGQKTFVYPPKSIKYLNAHLVSDYDPQQYCLLRAQYLSDGSLYFAEKHTVDFFMESDLAQKPYTKWVNDLEAAVRKDPMAQNESAFTQLNTRFKELVIESEDKNSLFRLTKALVVSLGLSMEVSDHLEKLYNWTVYYFSTNARLISRRVNQGQLLTLLSPIIRHSAKSTEDILKQRNACLLLLILLENFRLSMIDIYNTSEIVDFFERLLTENEDKQSQLYALNCLFYSAKSATKLFESLEFVNRKKLAASLTYLSAPLEELNYETLSRLKSKRAYLRYKLAHCAHWYLHQVLERETGILPNEGTAATLNRQSASSGLTLSPDCLSPRGNTAWQSVTSTMGAKPGAHMNSYHFEVLLLTDGPMKIGWLARSKDPFKPTLVEMMAYLNLNAYNETADQVELKAKKAKVTAKGQPMRWSVGDVVRCVLDFTQSAVFFYLNKQFIKVQSILLEDVPFFATIALGPLQQVVVNFGQVPISNEHYYEELHLFPGGNMVKVKAPIVGEFFSYLALLGKDSQKAEKKKQTHA